MFVPAVGLGTCNTLVYFPNRLKLVNSNSVGMILENTKFNISK